MHETVNLCLLSHANTENLFLLLCCPWLSRVLSCYGCSWVEHGRDMAVYDNHTWTTSWLTRNSDQFVCEGRRQFSRRLDEETELVTQDDPTVLASGHRVSKQHTQKYKNVLQTPVRPSDFSTQSFSGETTVHHKRPTCATYPFTALPMFQTNK